LQKLQNIFSGLQCFLSVSDVVTCKITVFHTVADGQWSRSAFSTGNR